MTRILQSASTWHCAILGNDPLHLSHLNIESIGISLGPENETILLTQYGAIPREIFYTGRSEDAGLLLLKWQTGAGIGILSEVPGYMKRTEIGGWDDPEQVRIGVLYDTDLMPFERTLSMGEEFTTAGVSLVSFSSGEGFHDPHWVLPGYTAEVLIRRVNTQGPPWIYNTWEPFERAINHDTVMELIDAAGAMGIDIFTIDDGWQQTYGDNDCEPVFISARLEAHSGCGRRQEACDLAFGFRWRQSPHRAQTTAAIPNGPRWTAREDSRQPRRWAAKWQ